MSVEDVVPVKLSLLGNTSKEVAASLRAEGVKGRQTEAGACPVAVFLKRKLPAYYFSVFSTVGVRQFDDWEDNIPVPKPVFHFLLDFDSGVYPDLIEEGSS